MNMNRRVRIIRRVRMDGRWVYVSPVVSAKGRVSPELVVVDGRQVRVDGGVWYITWYEGTRKRRKPIGATLTPAVVEKVKQERILAAQNAGVSVQETSDPNRLTIATAVSVFLDDVEKAGGSRDKLDLYRIVTEAFRDVCRQTYVDRITRSDVLDYVSHLRSGEDPLSDRTIFNRWVALCTFLRSDIVQAAGLRVENIVRKGDKPKFVKKEPRAYSDEDVKALLAASDEYSGLVFEALLKTGFRYRELAHLEWSDVSFADRTARVTAKPHWGFKPKDSEEREVPLESGLLERLKLWRQKHPKTRLVLGTRGDRPDNHWLPMLKKAARDAKLNCGHCNGCKERNECEHWFLHRFRATFVTKLLRDGLDLATVMKLSGHFDLKSVQRYIAPGRGKAVRDKVNAAFAGLTREPQLTTQPAEKSQERRFAAPRTSSMSMGGAPAGTA